MKSKRLNNICLQSWAHIGICLLVPYYWSTHVLWWRLITELCAGEQPSITDGVTAYHANLLSLAGRSIGGGGKGRRGCGGNGIEGEGAGVGV